MRNTQPEKHVIISAIAELSKEDYVAQMPVAAQFPPLSVNAKLVLERKFLMVDQTDIIRAAALCIQEHGEDAWLEAVSKSTDLKEAGDLAGSQLWVRIAEAVTALSNQEPPGSPDRKN